VAGDKRGGGASRETMMTETMTIEKKTTKKLIPNLLSAHPRADQELGDVFEYCFWPGDCKAPVKTLR
jgi:hypothetical protein